MAEVSQRVNGVLGKYGTGTLFVNYDEQTGGAAANSENGTNFEQFADVKVKKILAAQAVGDQQISLQVGCLAKYIDTSYGNTLWDGGGVIDLESLLGSSDNVNSISVPAEAKSIGLNSSDYALFLEQTLKWVSVPYSKMQFKLLAHVSGESVNNRQGLKKAMDRKRKYVYELKKLEVEEMEKEGKNVFISGSLDDSSEEDKAYKIAKAICRKLIDNGFNIVTGFGMGIGYYVAGASIQKLESINENIEDRLIMRPFADDMSPEEIKQYRSKLIANTKFTIVMYGQVIDNNGNKVAANGVLEEVRVSEKQNNYIIPIGSTGYAAEKVALNIKNNITNYPYLENYIDNLCVESDPNAIAKLVLHIITDIKNNVVSQ